MEEPDADKVKTREDFIQFLKALDKNFDEDMKRNKGKNEITGNSEWAHWDTGDYLEGMAACLEDGGEYSKTKTLTWKDLANIILMGKHYE